MKFIFGWFNGLAVAVLPAMLGQSVRGAPGISTDRTTVQRLPLVQQRINPAGMTETARGCYLIDFGKAHFAGLEIEIGKPEAGRKVIVRMGEALSGSRRSVPSTMPCRTSNALRLISWLSGRCASTR